MYGNEGGLCLSQFKKPRRKPSCSQVAHFHLSPVRPKLPATCIPLRTRQDKACARRKVAIFGSSSPSLISHSLCILQPDLTQLQSGSKNIMNFASHTRQRPCEINFAGAPAEGPADWVNEGDDTTTINVQTSNLRRSLTKMAAATTTSLLSP